jgi:hypothetical protein
MDPNIWGQKLWDSITYIIANYPDNPTSEDKTHYYNYLTSLQFVLPCEECRHNFSKHIKLRPLTLSDLESREKLMMWRVDLQNAVNKKLKKKELSYDEAFKKINKLLKPKSNKKKSVKPKKIKKPIINNIICENELMILLKLFDKLLVC